MAETDRQEGTSPVLGAVTLASLAGGAAAELFTKELDVVVRNIADVNTDPKAAREITLKVKISPSEERDVGDVLVTCTSKLGPIKGVRAAFYFGRIKGRLVAVENNPRQAGLFDQPRGVVEPLKGGKE